MTDKYLFRDIQTADRGRGFLAVDLLTSLAYTQALMVLVMTLFNLTFTMNGIMGALSMILMVAVEVVAIYVLRLALRAIFVLRDRTAYETIDQDARYKTSSSST